ncbi:MAG: hypothetical protein Kow0074_01190 [Candidatus Zixiibacteriota bacterium]
MIAIPVGTTSAAEWRSWAEGGYSSSYTTRAWYDSTSAQLTGPLKTQWRLGQHLDLLRNDLASGGDVRQRNHRLTLTARPFFSGSGWTVDIAGTDNAIKETVDRRTLAGEAFLGRVISWQDALSLQMKVGAIASRHQASMETTSDAGLGYRTSAEWSPDLRAKSDLMPQLVNASIRHNGDQRDRLRADDTRWALASNWQWTRDSLELIWGEHWSSTRFYPNPEQFDDIGRQEYRQRSIRLAWNHGATNHASGGLRSWIAPFTWRIEADAGLDGNSYATVASEQAIATLPRDTRTTERGYLLQTGRSIGPAFADIQYRYRWVKDRFGERRRNQTAETGEVEGRLQWQVTESDSLTVRTIFRVTSYAAPGDSSFFEDRDQAERVIEVAWWRRVSSVFSIRPTFSFRGFRQVYISEQFSANNNTDDVYLLAPEFDWQPSRILSILQRVSVRAHYRFFEFERSDPDGRGTLYRRAESQTRVGIRQSRQVTWRLRYIYRYEDFGGLFDRDGWVQSVDWDRRSHLMDATLEWRPSANLIVKPNLGLEFKRAFQHRLDGGDIARIKDEPFKRQYVGLEVRWTMLSGLTLRGSLARRVQQFGGSPKDRDDRWNINVSRPIP